MVINNTKFMNLSKTYEDQILKNSKIPADISEDLSQKAIDWAGTIAEELGYIGTMCVEYFIDQNDNLYVNEIAPESTIQDILQSMRTT